jgi:2-keto-4-pentenoate hydratase/2-oxohepta-3-ene-1,7-dioic acid hydratase in catechol pathway
MKICRYIAKNDLYATPRMGIVLEDEGIVIDPQLVWACDYQREGYARPYDRASFKIPLSLHTLLNHHDNPHDALEESWGLYLFLKKVGDLVTREGVHVFQKIDDVRFVNPMDRISTYRDFYAHEKHVAAGFKKRGEPIPAAWYEIPAYYKGATEGFIGDQEEILWPHYTDILDYELELAMIIGRDGKNIKEGDAQSHIFGYTILNDISARDIQKKEMAVRLGPAKGKDFCSILGPVIVTADEFEHKEPDLEMTAKINNELWSKGRSGDIHFTWAQMIAHVSQDEWLLPGDVFGSGTVGTGCGLELGKWIQPGDKIELSIEGIGTLTNTVGAKRIR